MVEEQKLTVEELAFAMDKLAAPKSQSGDTQKRNMVMRRVLSARNERRLHLEAQRKADEKRRIRYMKRNSFPHGAENE